MPRPLVHRAALGFAFAGVFVCASTMVVSLSRAAPKGAPKAEPTPAPPQSPSTAELIKMPTLDPKGGTVNDAVVAALSQRNSLTKAQFEEVAKTFGVTVNGAGAGEATSLTIRHPYAHEGAYLTMPFADDVRPDASPDGAMSVQSGGQVYRVWTGARATSATPEEFSRANNPLDPGFPADAVVDVRGPGYVGIHLVTEPYRAYVVSCRVAGAGVANHGDTPGQFAVVVRRGGTYARMIRELVPAAGRVSFALPGKKKRVTYDLALVAYGRRYFTGQLGLEPFSLSGCDVAPID